MTKKLLSAISLALAFCLILSVCAIAAAPTVISPSETGNSTASLVWVKRPASGSATTTERNYTVTAAGLPGVDVTVFRRSSYDGNYYRVYQGGYLLSGTIGPSGVYVVSINLVEGGNKMLIFAENDNECQYIRIDITRLSQSQIDQLNGLSIGDMVVR